MSLQTNKSSPSFANSLGYPSLLVPNRSIPRLGQKPIHEIHSVDYAKPCGVSICGIFDDNWHGRLFDTIFVDRYSHGLRIFESLQLDLGSPRHWHNSDLLWSVDRLSHSIFTRQVFVQRFCSEMCWQKSSFEGH